jgi:hypothetical protein
MSIDYFCVPTSDLDSARATIEGEAPASLAALDKEVLAARLLRREPSFERFAVDHAEIARFEKTSTEEARAKYSHIELNWQGDGGYVQCTIENDHVHVAHGGGGDRHLAVVEVVLEEMTSAGLHVYDPQNDEMMNS